MKRLFTALAATMALYWGGCSRSDEFAGYTQHSGDFGTFIRERAARFGARSPQTNGLPRFSAEWRSKEDADGVQVYLRGDYFSQLQSFLTAAWGPARPPSTNEMGGAKSIGTFYGADLGAALTFRYETTRDGKGFTSLTIVKQKR
jgi:hypothetical protein